jgi:hypothetical protein
MKTTLLILALLILTSCASQNKMASSTNVAFSYNWQVADGTLIINFANNKEFPEYSSSRAGKGNIKIKCRQEYLDFIDILRSNEIGYFHFNTVEVYLGVSNDNIIIIDSSGCLWKLSKPDALILADKLSLTMWIASINLCADVPCTCNKR